MLKVFLFKINIFISMHCEDRSNCNLDLLLLCGLNIILRNTVCYFVVIIHLFVIHNFNLNQVKFHLIFARFSYLFVYHYENNYNLEAFHLIIL